MGNDSYLRWDAESIQQILRKKLLSQQIYTDQMYPGSDLSIILDLFAWTFDILTYILNNNASDSLFSDTQVYQNMNRIVKLLSYNPNGYHSCTASFSLKINNQQLQYAEQLLPDNCTIPKFTSIDTGKTDTNGKNVKYSFIDDYTFGVYTTSTNSTVITPENWPLLYNGQFKKYSEVFTATSLPYETFVLNNINPTDNIYAEHDSFHIYVETINQDTGQTTYSQWTQVDNLVLDADSQSTAFELRLNQKKIYQLSFGDDIHGKKLNIGDRIHIIYLESNVEDGKIQNGQVSVDTLTFNVPGFANTIQLLDICFGGLNKFKRKYKGLFAQNNVIKDVCSKLTLTNIKESSQPESFQDVQNIRHSAPDMFRMGQRLVTVNDYSVYIKDMFPNLIADIWTCNNITYISTFYQWLNLYGCMNISIRKYNYLFTDSCDFNNIYIWVKAKTRTQLSNDDMNIMLKKCNRIKTATTELVPCNAIIKYFRPFVQHKNYPFNIEETTISDWDPQTKIRITKKSDTYFTNSQIVDDVNQKIVQFFSIENQSMGNTVLIQKLYNQIMKLEYIESIHTVNIPTNDPKNEFIVDGLSFAAFTVKIINGKDFNTVTYADNLLPFQYAQLYDTDVKNYIEVQNKDSFSLTNTGF